jgi:hypothetical protein
MKLLLPSYALCNMSVQVMYHILALVSHVPSKIVHFTPLSTQVLRSLKFFSQAFSQLSALLGSSIALRFITTNGSSATSFGNRQATNLHQQPYFYL